jgi:starch synthase
MAVVYLKRKYREYNTKAIYTIHNIEYQGVYGGELLSEVFDLDGYDWSTVEMGGNINLMKGAICCCDILTTVSERYAEEIRTPYFAFGLDKIISDFGYKTRGIVNGIDYVYYNPEIDTVIARNFNENSLEEGKAECVKALRAKLGLPNKENVPVIVTHGIDSETLSHRVGKKCGILAVNDKGFADSILKNFEGGKAL